MKKNATLKAPETLIMKCIWSTKEELSLSNIYQMTVERYHKDWKCQKVSAFLEKLVRKGFIYPKREGDKVVYNFLISEEEYKTQQTKEFLAFYKPKPMFHFPTGLNRKKDFTPTDYKELQRILEELDD